jgi:hypothetical protein
VAEILFFQLFGSKSYFQKNSPYYSPLR